MSGADDLERLHFVEQELLKRWPESRLEPTLERIAYLCDALGSPQLSYPTIHLTGTNGKTTTSRMIDAILYQLGYRTGRFTSPHLEQMTERIAINGEPIPAEGFVAAYDDIALYLEMVDSRMSHPLSFFESITAIAFVAFAEYPVDVGVIEVGMGGEWDATNVANGSVNVITPIGFDHMEYLGETLTKIASTKSGIIKPGSITVLAAQEVEAAKVLLERCIEVESAPLREGIEFSLTSREIALGGQMIAVDGVNGSYSNIFLPLHGAHQAHNAAVAIAAAEAFVGEKSLDEEVVREALALVKSPGRIEIVHRDPTVILDAAHNPHGMRSLIDTLHHEFDFSDRIAIFAPMGDKDVEGMLQLMESTFDTIVVTKNSSQRALEVERLAEMARRLCGDDRIVSAQSLPAAIEKGIEIAHRRNLAEKGSAAVIVTGSVVTVGEARVLVRHRKENRTGGREEL